jgi:hypothetical protein
MSDTFGHTYGTPLARYDRDSQSWRTSEDTSLWDLPTSLGTLPTWGMTQGGDLFELPTPERPTSAHECSSLPTPQARDYKDQILGTPHGHGQINLPQALYLLPTPAVNDMGGGQNNRVVGRVGAASEVIGRQASATRQESFNRSTANDVDWGKYQQAVRRWEALSRPAPSPTFNDKDGRARLSPAFVEWMMGLPEGHVTGHGLSVAQELKMLGNGVVPQQAALALKLLGVTA